MKPCITLLLLSLVAVPAWADKYDDAVTAARNAPPAADPAPEPAVPTYAETVRFIEKSVQYSLTETGRCHFRYRATPDDMLDISDFNIGEMQGWRRSLLLTCELRNRYCVTVEHHGYGGYVANTGAPDVSLYPASQSRAEMEKLTEAITHLIVLCGGSRTF